MNENRRVDETSTQHFTRLLEQNSVINKRMKGFVGWPYISDQPVGENIRNELHFFQNKDNEILTNMKQGGNFSEGNDHLLVSLQGSFFNPDGAVLDWGDKVNQVGLRKFIETSKVSLIIEDKPYFETPLADLIKLPTVATAGTDGIALVQPQLNGQWKLGTQEVLPAKQNFDVVVIGEAGAYNTAFGFKSDFRLRMVLNTIRRRNVQS